MARATVVGMCSLANVQLAHVYYLVTEHPNARAKMFSKSITCQDNKNKFFLVNLKSRQQWIMFSILSTWKVHMLTHMYGNMQY